MRLLLDTHVFLWYITADPKLPATFREASQSPDNEVRCFRILGNATLLSDEITQQYNAPVACRARPRVAEVRPIAPRRLEGADLGP